MASRRLELHQTLKQQFIAPTEPHVYFQPPQNTRLVYPCIIYKLSNLPVEWANNLPYRWTESYEMTYITSDANDSMVGRLISLRETRFVRYYSADNLHHFVYVIYA